MRFEEELLDEGDYQGNAVINYTEKDIPFTRIIEHKYFNDKCTSNKTIITREYPEKWVPGKEPYYPINNEKNQNIFEMYKILSEKESRIVFGGRLAFCHK